uniref:Uncharacterized protein n=1 Tax=Setaria italica TaxID=4555 RepID=K3ZBR8_SETIT
MESAILGQLMCEATDELLCSQGLPLPRNVQQRWASEIAEPEDLRSLHSLCSVKP